MSEWLPQLLLIVLQVLGLGIQLARHGDRRDGETYDVLTGLIALAIMWSLLTWGGFFDGLLSR